MSAAITGAAIGFLVWLVTEPWSHRLSFATFTFALFVSNGAAIGWLIGGGL